VKPLSTSGAWDERAVSFRRAPADADTLALAPRLADRAVVARPEVPLIVPRGGQVRVYVFSSGHTRLGKRESNQDSYLVDNDLEHYIVSDGMGGHAAGEAASAIVVDAVRQHVLAAGEERSEDADSAAELQRTAVLRAREQVFEGRHVEERDGGNLHDEETAGTARL
jgi:hypothetical protein